MNMRTNAVPSGSALAKPALFDPKRGLRRCTPGLALVALLCAASANAATLVVLPFDNFSGAENAPATVHDLVVKAATAKGWTVAPDDQTEKVLEENRVRYLDSIDGAVRATIVESAGAEAVLSGTVYEYTNGRNPIVAVSARLVRADGTLAWSDIAGLSADETEGVLGFGREATTEGVAKHVIESLLREFPAPGRDSAPMKGPSKPLFHRGPASFHVPELDPKTPHLVCVLPFENLSQVPEASRVVADVLAIRLAAANGFEVVEPAKLRAAALKARIGSFRGISSDDLARLSAAVGTPLFIRGTIFQYADGSNRSIDPELQIDLSLVDVNAGRVLWTAQHDRKGSDYIGFLMLGAVSNAVSLTDHVIAEMIATAANGRVGDSNGPARAAIRDRDQQTRLRGRTKNGEHQ